MCEWFFLTLVSKKPAIESALYVVYCGAQTHVRTRFTISCLASELLHANQSQYVDHIMIFFFYGQKLIVFNRSQYSLEITLITLIIHT